MREKERENGGGGGGRKGGVSGRSIASFFVHGVSFFNCMRFSTCRDLVRCLQIFETLTQRYGIPSMHGMGEKRGFMDDSGVSCVSE